MIISSFRSTKARTAARNVPLVQNSLCPYDKLTLMDNTKLEKP